MISDNLEKVLQRISEVSRQAGRSEVPRLVGVTKKRTLPEIIELVEAGLVHLAENRWDEWASKKKDLDRQGLNHIQWHFIGGLQGRSLRRYYEPLFRIDSLDSLDHAKMLSALLEKAKGVQQVLVEVNISEGAGRSGVLPDVLDSFLDSLTTLSGINISGLMVMGPLPDPEGGREETRRVFSRAREVWDRSRNHWPFLQDLSMGMSEDFEEGILAGCTEVRIGRLLFEGGRNE
ncbi:MAG: YggS family pyridoxal phosphate-dependent enzyme [Nitrospirota bacterium]|nr:YggS family pyridoxal phosphate-dependent enzyme [Nitrospirota bacterium]